MNLLNLDKITIRGVRGGKVKSRVYDIIDGRNDKNLIKIKKSSNNNIYMTVGCVNVRSVRNKTADFVDNIIDDKYDICPTTETWLTSQDDVKQVEATPAGYQFLHCPRPGRTGGGTGLVCKSSMNPRLITSGNTASFEYSKWSIKYSTYTISVVVIYRPPYSEKNPVSVNTFITEFGDYLESVITDQNRLIIGGDFNIHMEDKENASVEKLTDMLDSMNMQNHVNIPTHVSGHVLDLLITRNSEQLFIGQPERRYFISDHAFIRFKTIMEKPEVQIKHISYRRLNDIDLELFKKDLRESKIMENQNKSVHKKAMIYDQVLRELLDKHAPMKEKQIKVMQGSPWYDQNLKDLKKKKRAAEKVWLQSGDVDSFEKFKRFRYEYICSCNHAKCDFYSKEILKCDGNQKKLYNLISRLTAGDKLVP